MYVPTALGSATLISTNSKLTSDQKAAINRMVRGQRLTFDGITAKSPSGRIIELQGIILTID
jgi:hypothetical protein